MRPRPGDDDPELAELRRRQGRLPAARPLGDALAQVLARRGYAQEQTAEQWSSAWREAAGPALAAHSRPGRLLRGVLEIAVRNSAALQELSMRKRALLVHLAAAGPAGAALKDLRFRLLPVD